MLKKKKLIDIEGKTIEVFKGNPRKQAKPEPEPNCVYMTYAEDREGGEICEGEENLSYPCHEDEDTTFDPTGLYLNAPAWSETVEVDFDPSSYLGQEIYVIVVRYSTGDTFGRRNGAWTVIGAYVNEEQVVKIEKSIEDGSYNKGHYVPWKGYFESFERIERHVFTLRTSAPGDGEKSYTKVIRH